MSRAIKLKVDMDVIKIDWTCAGTANSKVNDVNPN